MSAREKMIEEILQILKEKKGKAEFGYLFSRMFEKHALTKDSLRSYLDALRTTGKIDYPVGYVTSVEDSLLITLKEKKE
jgi:hypothetical protein